MSVKKFGAMGGSNFSALTIAGSDPSAEAGIAADIKTFASLGVKGFFALSCLTAQNRSEVFRTLKIPADFLDAQFYALRKNRPNAVKTGALLDEQTVISVCRNIRKFSLENVICDPVIKSSSGVRLLTDGGVRALKNELLPLCRFVTPNIDEARALCGMSVKNTGDVRAAARKIAGFGVKNVVITGGHRSGGQEVCDTLFDGEKFFEIKRPRLKTGEAHGSGCVFSAALCALTAKGLDELEATRKAGFFTADFIKFSLSKSNRRQQIR